MATIMRGVWNQVACSKDSRRTHILHFGRSQLPRHCLSLYLAVRDKLACIMRRVTPSTDAAGVENPSVGKLGRDLVMWGRSPCTGRQWRLDFSWVPVHSQQMTKRICSVSGSMLGEVWQDCKADEAYSLCSARKSSVLASYFEPSYSCSLLHC